MSEPFKVHELSDDDLRGLSDEMLECFLCAAKSYVARIEAVQASRVTSLVAPVLKQALALLPGAVWGVVRVSLDSARFFAGDVEFRLVVIRGDECWTLEALVQDPLRPSTKTYRTGKPSVSDLVFAICEVVRRLHEQALCLSGREALSRRLGALYQRLKEGAKSCV